jgi:hypothetical protein
MQSSDFLMLLPWLLRTHGMLFLDYKFIQEIVLPTDREQGGSGPYQIDPGGRRKKAISEAISKIQYMLE